MDTRAAHDRLCKSSRDYYANELADDNRAVQRSLNVRNKRVTSLLALAY